MTIELGSSDIARFGDHRNLYCTAVVGGSISTNFFFLPKITDWGCKRKGSFNLGRVTN